MDTNMEKTNMVTLTRKDLTVDCLFNHHGRLVRKRERHGSQCALHAYRYDSQGRLADVALDGSVTETFLVGVGGQLNIPAHTGASPMTPTARSTTTAPDA